MRDISLLFGDMDINGHVNNVAIARFFEEVRACLITRCHELSETGGTGVLAHVEIDYLTEVFYPGSVQVGTGIASTGRTSFTQDSALFQNGRCAATCRSVGVWVDPGTRVPAEMPDGYRRALASLQVREASTVRGDVRLRKMTAEEFVAWRETALAEYRHTLAEREQFHDDVAAQQLAVAAFERALPDGMATRGAGLFVVLDDQQRQVGTLWIGAHPQRPDAGYVFSIEVDAAHRGRGLGRQIMLAAEREATGAGYHALGLSVSASNAVARSLYTSLGYGTGTLAMIKELGSPA